MRCRDVIYYLETYDVTTVRASTPMYLLSRVIKSMGIKMVLSGEGADELFGGYLYFHKAPDARAFHEETVRKLGKLHLYDCLRANKALAAWGVEGRVPFLDKEFMDIAMRINPEAKMAKDGRMEKWIVRKAFEDLLPESVVWRQKEQFSDGVGYGWIDSLKKVTSEAVSDEQMSHARRALPDQPADEQGRVLLPFDLRGALPLAIGRPLRAVGAFRRLQHRRGTGLGRFVPEPERSLGPGG